ncbi:TPA: O-antigen ligase family protein [Aeromonas salmonicida]|nr:O-antigen ligase family protein [Aeromonas salmonicida]HEH9422613.1 O-antigen ligase family protein [Aeromonas salmonicida]HEH9435672.1 O-antigen ligase family protein [Aeromonas salmonicida]
MIGATKHRKALDFLLHVYYLSPIFLLSCLAFNTEGGKHYISRLVVAMLIASLVISRDLLWLNINRLEIKKILFFWLPIIIFFSGYHVFLGESFSIPRTILVSLIYISVVPWGKISKQAVLIAILCGGCVAGVMGFYEHAVLNIRRVGGIINQIPFALYVAISLLMAVHVLWVNKERHINILAWLSVIGSAFSIIMSEVRGIWLALIFIAMLFIFRKLQQFSIHRLAAVTVILLTTLFLLSSIPEVTHRIDETKQEFTLISEGDRDTSIGIRLQLWLSAINVIKIHPFVGAGTKNYPHIMDQQYQQGMITKAALSFKYAHYHNQYLDSYVRYGIIGFIIAVVILISPSILYGQQDKKVMNLYLSISGVCVFAGLTDVPLIHTGVVYILVLYPAVLFLSSREKAGKISKCKM